MLNEIKERSQDGPVVCPVGVGSAFARKNYNSSFIVANKGKTLLIDLGRNIPEALHAKGIKTTDFDYYYFTHDHADHVGGVEELLLMSRYVTKQKPNVLAYRPFADALWENTLSGGCSANEVEELTFDDFANIIEPTEFFDEDHSAYFELEKGFELKTFRVKHGPNLDYWATSVCINNQFWISGDSLFDSWLLAKAQLNLPIKHFFHDCQLFEPAVVHATYNQLKTLPECCKNLMHLYHYGDNFEDFTPENDGFAGFAKAWEIYG